MKVFYFLLFTISGLLFMSHKEANDEIKISKEERIADRLHEVKSTINSNSKFDKEIVFLIDMKIKSGKKRFFIYDLKNNKILDEGLVAHGSGSETKDQGNLKFSNEPNSKSSSLGKYSIGKFYIGKFGKAYKLHGLEESNNNAYLRNIVLHHYSAVPYEEQNYFISNSQGCPMINEVFFKKIEKYIDRSKSIIILDIYY